MGNIDVIEQMGVWARWKDERAPHGDWTKGHKHNRAARSKQGDDGRAVVVSWLTTCVHPPLV